MLLEELIDAFVEASLEVFGRERVECIVLHGSALKGGAIPGYSDVDFQLYLAPECFDEHGALADEQAFALQERIGPLPWQEAGYRYPQASFLDVRRLPEWWTGPIPGAYRVLFGRLPADAIASAEGLRASSRRYLSDELPARIRSGVGNFADADDATLPRRVRLLGTDVAPAVFALIAYDAPDALELWALSKLEALVRLEARYPGVAGPADARRFFDNVRILYGGEFEPELGRQTFRAGVAFLRWAERLGQALGAGEAT